MPEQIKSLQQEAVDHAFILHVSRLFDRFCEALKDEKDHNPANSHARRTFEKDYSYARLTHKEMTDVITSQK